MWALDTNTISYYFRGDEPVVTRLQALAPSDVGVPAIVAYELRDGLLRLPDEASRPRLQALEQLLRPMQFLDFDYAASQVAARIRVSLERDGSPIGPHDLLIAASALRHGATLVTRNVREFARVGGLEVVSWHPN